MLSLQAGRMKENVPGAVQGSCSVPKTPAKGRGPPKTAPPPGTSSVSAAIEVLEKLTLDELNEVTAWCNAEMLSRIRSMKQDALKEIEETRARLSKPLRDDDIFERQINLNVRGTRFTTLWLNLSTLTNSYFTKMLESFPDGEGEELFIDRSPEHFGRILDYIQGDRGVLDGLSAVELRRLRREAEFYNIRGLIELCHLKEKPTFDYLSGNVVLSEDNSVATKLRSNDWRGIVTMGEAIDVDGCTGQSVERSVELVRGNEVFIGLATESILHCASPTPQFDCGWYMHAATGSLYSQQGDKARGYHSIHSSGAMGPQTIVTIKMNASRDVSFTVNDIEHGIAFRLGKVDTEMRLFVVVILYGKNCAVRALS